MPKLDNNFYEKLTAIFSFWKANKAQNVQIIG